MDKGSMKSVSNETNYLVLQVNMGWAMSWVPLCMHHRVWLLTSHISILPHGTCLYLHIIALGFP